jgi:hypothetical protein
LGTIYIEAHKLIDMDPSLAALSLSDLRCKLDDEGFPIDLLIDELSDLSKSNENILDTLLHQVKFRLHEPEGLQVLASCIENQGQQVSNSIYQLLDVSVKHSISINEVGGGIGKRIENHPWKFAGGLTACGLVGFGIYKVYSRRKEEQAFAEAQRAVDRDVQRAVDRDLELADNAFRSTARIEMMKAEARPAVAYKDLLKSSEEYKDYSSTLALRKEVSEYTESEIEKIIEPFAKVADSIFHKALSGRRSIEVAVKKRLLGEFANDNAWMQADEIYKKQGISELERDRLHIELTKSEITRLSDNNYEEFRNELRNFFSDPFKDAFRAYDKGESPMPAIEHEFTDLDDDIVSRIQMAEFDLGNKVKDDLSNKVKSLERDLEQEVDACAERIKATVVVDEYVIDDSGEDIVNATEGIFI